MRPLSRAAILAQSVAHMRLLVVDSLETAFSVANDYAPEHLLLQIREPRAWLPQRPGGGSGVSRQLVAGVHGGLLQRAESHSAHVRLRQSL